MNNQSNHSDDQESINQQHYNLVPVNSSNRTLNTLNTRIKHNTGLISHYTTCIGSAVRERGDRITEHRNEVQEKGEREGVEEKEEGRKRARSDHVKG